MDKNSAKVATAQTEIYKFGIKRLTQENKYGNILYGDASLVLEEYNELNKNYKRLKEDLLYIQQIGIGVYIFPNRKILGYDITDSPSEIEIKKEILEDTIKNIIEGVRKWQVKKL